MYAGAQAETNWLPSANAQMMVVYVTVVVNAASQPQALAAPSACDAMAPGSARAQSLPTRTSMTAVASATSAMAAARAQSSHSIADSTFRRPLRRAASPSRSLGSSSRAPRRIWAFLPAASVRTADVLHALTVADILEVCGGDHCDAVKLQTLFQSAPPAFQGWCPFCRQWPSLCEAYKQALVDWNAVASGL